MNKIIRLMYRAYYKLTGYPNDLRGRVLYSKRYHRYVKGCRVPIEISGSFNHKAQYVVWMHCDRCKLVMRHVDSPAL
jgi:hypothetical protein